MSITSVAPPTTGAASPGPLDGAARNRSASRRTIRPSTLPGTRAVLGAFLVTASAVVAFAVANRDEAGPAGGSVAVAARDLSPGTVLGPDDVRLVTIDLPAGTVDTVFSSTGDLLGAVVRGPIGGGAILDRAAITPADDDVPADLFYREVSLAVPRARALNGRLVEGDMVDLVLTGDTGTAVIVERAVIVDVGDDGSELAASPDIVLTLALPDPADAIAVAHGGAGGELTVLRSTRATDSLPAAYRPDPPEAPPSTPSAGAGTVVVNGVSS